MGHWQFHWYAKGREDLFLQLRRSLVLAKLKLPSFSTRGILADCVFLDFWNEGRRAYWWKLMGTVAKTREPEEIDATLEIGRYGLSIFFYVMRILEFGWQSSAKTICWVDRACLSWHITWCSLTILYQLLYLYLSQSFRSSVANRSWWIVLSLMRIVTERPKSRAKNSWR